MNLKQIRYALAVAEELNFTRAAQRCHTVQSALSHQIAKLEEELGCTLFERTSRRVRLTPPAFVACAAPVGGAAGAGGGGDGGRRRGVRHPDHRHHFNDKRDGSDRKARQVSPPLSGGEYPPVRRHERSAAGGRTPAKCDMAFVGIWPGDADLLPMSHRQLADEPLVALVAPQHPLAGRERVNLQALAEVPLVDFSAAPARGAKPIAPFRRRASVGTSVLKSIISNGWRICGAGWRRASYRSRPRNA